MTCAAGVDVLQLCTRHKSARGSRMGLFRSRTASASRVRELGGEQVVAPGAGLVQRARARRALVATAGRGAARGVTRIGARARHQRSCGLGGWRCPQWYCLTGKSLVSLSFIVDVSREAQSAERPVALEPASGCLVARGLGSRVRERRHPHVRCGLDSGGSPHVAVHVVALPRLVARRGHNHAGSAAGPATRIRASARDPPGFGERMAAGGARCGVGGDWVGAL